MQNTLLIAIGLFGLASYTAGIREMLQNRYAPSTFSRVVWVLLAINNFAGVLASDGSQASLLLVAVLLLGNIAVCTLSFWKGTRTIGLIEYICVALLLLSGLVWIFFSAPLVNLALSLIAYLIGAIPTYKKVWLDPRSESTAFWGFFAIASLLSIFASTNSSLEQIVIPIFFTFFDGGFFLLSLRKFKSKFRSQ